MPEGSRRIDGVIDVGRAHPAWGPIRGDLDGRLVLVEHFGAPPSEAALASVYLKLAALVERWVRAHPRPPRPPLALVLSVGRPERALATFGLQARPPAGCWTGSVGPGAVLLVDVRGLAPGPGTTYLRLFDHRRSVVEQNLARLYRDPDVDSKTKLALGEAIMAEPAVWDPVEQRLTAQELLTRGRAALLRRLLAAQEGLLTPRVEAALAACDDPARIEAASLLLLRPQEPAALEAAVHACLVGARS